ncbi:hypothetical protein ACFYXF_10050 [Streptomyces sp. NPDC002680]|uniref:hypothetical protein n=1 Tax=Streptomyces sp. NPDC002680 TaxID=3364659 RepID=UPI0036B57E7F
MGGTRSPSRASSPAAYAVSRAMRTTASSAWAALPSRASSRAPIPPDFSRVGGAVAHAERTEAAWAANAVAATAASRSTSEEVTDTNCATGGRGSNGACQSGPLRARATSGAWLEVVVRSPEHDEQ